MNTLILKVLVVGVGRMGSAHARGYAKLPGYEIAGFVVDSDIERAKRLASDLGLSIPVYTDYHRAIRESRPDVVSINTHADTHASYAIHAMKQGCHVFVEKPIATNLAEAEMVVWTARETGRKLLAGYILRVHPAWIEYIALSRTLGKPLVMRMCLNQQGMGREWELQKKSISIMPPLVSCGVHYIDVMCQMTGSKPRSVNCVAARVSDEIAPDEKNYCSMQIVFEDGSVGWFEVGWGPMMSRSAFFIQDVIGPGGSVSIDRDTGDLSTADISKHASVSSIVVHASSVDMSGKSAWKDRVYRFGNELDHDELCMREQKYLYDAIALDIDMRDRLEDAVNSLRICLAGVRAYSDGNTVRF